jgi:transposase
MELQAGQPTRKGNKRGAAYAYNVKELRDREIELARPAEQACERVVGQWQRRGNPKRRTGAETEERRPCGHPRVLDSVARVQPNPTGDPR